MKNGNITKNNNSICNFCNKEFKSRQYKWEHQNKFCKFRNNISENPIEIIKKENEDIKKNIQIIINLKNY